MSWKERLQGAYISENNLRTEFIYEDLSNEIKINAEVKTFPFFSGALVERYNIAETTFPLRLFFSGDDHDLEAEEFIKILTTDSYGILELALFGRIENVALIGSIKRTESLINEANQTVLELTFVQSAKFQFPQAIFSVNEQITENIQTIETSQAEAFAANVQIKTPSEKISLKNSVLNQLNKVKKQLRGLATRAADVQRQFDQISADIENNLNALIGNPLALAAQIFKLIQAPATSAGQVKNQIFGYTSFLNQLTDNFQKKYKNITGNSQRNEFFSTENFSSAAINGLFLASQSAADLSAQNAGRSILDFYQSQPETAVFLTKNNILIVINQLNEIFDSLTAWQEESRIDLDRPDSTDVYATQRQTLALLSDYLIKIAFVSKQEIEYRLPAAAHFIPLCAELYGIVDPAFDFFIESCELTGQELFEIPTGRLIKYYK